MCLRDFLHLANREKEKKKRNMIQLVEAENMKILSATPSLICKATIPKLRNSLW